MTENVLMTLKSYPVETFDIIEWKKDWVSNWKLISHQFPEKSVEQFLYNRRENYLMNPEHPDHNGKSLMILMMIQPQVSEEKLGRKVNVAKLTKYIKRRERINTPKKEL